MKCFPVILVLFSFTLGGCEALTNVTDDIKQGMTASAQPHIRIFAAESHATYEAARIAVDQMNFRFLHGGAAQGELEAISSLDSGDSLHGTRQITLTVRFAPAAEEGSTEVRLWLGEVVEDNSNQNTGRATETPLRDSAWYEAFFRNLQQGLTPTKKG